MHVNARTSTLLCATALLLACGGQPAEQCASGLDAADSTADSAATPMPSADDTTAALTPSGWGKLRIGMTRSEVVAAAGEDANPEAVGGPDPQQCDEFRPTEAPEGLLVMIQQNRLTRIAITGDTGIQTDRGLEVGDSASAVKAAYDSRLIAKPHWYHPSPAEYLVVWNAKSPAPDARGIVYEAGADGIVHRILAGGPSIEYPEGCV